jgi:hypothetical protein
MCFLLNERERGPWILQWGQVMGSEENSSQAPFLSNYSSTLAASAQKIIIYI